MEMTRQTAGEASAVKAALRRELKAARERLSPAEVARDSAAVADRLRRLAPWQEAKEILAYLPTRNEVDPTALVTEALASGRRLLLPRCRDDIPGELVLGCIRCLADTVPGMFGIPEPRPDLCLPPEHVLPDLILVPGVAFDRRGIRLGFGGGYYDRLLAKPGLATAVTIGLCFEFQRVERLPFEPWDRPVDAVCTEKDVYWSL